MFGKCRRASGVVAIRYEPAKELGRRGGWVAPLGGSYILYRAVFVFVRS